MKSTKNYAEARNYLVSADLVSADYVCKIILKKNTLSILSLYKSLNDSEVIFNILLMKRNSFNFT